MSDTNIVKYELDGGQNVELSPETVKAYLVNGNGKVTDQEVYMFMELCKYQKINPFLREAYLIKFSDTKPASIVTGKELFAKRAERHPDYDGYEAGVIVMTSDKKLQNRPGTIYLKEYGDILIGGWAKVYRKSYKIAFESTVMFSEYKGPAGSLWDTKPATMIRKVAIVQALREAFPDTYGGLYSQEEMPVDGEKLPTEPIAPPPQDNQHDPDDENNPNKLIDEETQNYLCEQFNKDVNFAKKILGEFGYKNVKQVKFCDVEPILERTAEEREKMAAENVALPYDDTLPFGVKEDIPA